MILGFTSDIHKDICGLNNEYLFDKFKEEVEEFSVELILLLGDISNNFHDSVHFKNKLSEHLNIPVKLVIGNHEFYYPTSPGLTYEEIKDKTFEGIHKNIYGTMLGFDKLPNNIEFYRRLGFNDTRYLPYFLEWSEGENLFKENLLNTDLSNIDVIATHYAPLPNLATLNGVYTPGSCLFHCGNIAEIIQEKYPNKKFYWLFGHTHSSEKYQLGNITFISNNFVNHRYEPKSRILEVLEI